MRNKYGTIIPDVVEFGEPNWWVSDLRLAGPVYSYSDDTGETLRWVLEQTGGQWLIDELDKIKGKKF